MRREAKSSIQDLEDHALSSPSESSTTKSGVGGLGGRLKDQMATPTKQKSVLVIIHARPIQNPPRRNPIWKTVVMDKLATTFPNDWMISIAVNKRAVSSRSTKVVMIERQRKTKPDPDVWMIMLGIRVAIVGERPIPRVPTVRQNILRRASQRSFSVDERRGFRTRLLSKGRPKRNSGIDTVGRADTRKFACASVHE
jgi:hypothetical protein